MLLIIMICTILSFTRNISQKYIHPLFYILFAIIFTTILLFRCEIDFAKTDQNLGVYVNIAINQLIFSFNPIEPDTIICITPMTVTSTMSKNTFIPFDKQDNIEMYVENSINDSMRQYIDRCGVNPYLLEFTEDNYLNLYLEAKILSFLMILIVSFYGYKKRNMLSIFMFSIFMTTLFLLCMKTSVCLKYKTDFNMKWFTLEQFINFIRIFTNKEFTTHENT